MEDKAEMIEMTAEVVSAYVGNNIIAAADLPDLIRNVHRAFAGMTNGNGAPASAPQEPAVPVKKSVTPDYLVCLEDGRKFKSLRRHLRTHFDMSPEQYRA